MGVHLGKASAGWQFHFRAYLAGTSRPPAVAWDVVDFPSWLRLLDLGDIRDEYGTAHTSEEMVAVVEEMRANSRREPARDQFRDAWGNTFTVGEFC